MDVNFIENWKFSWKWRRDLIVVPIYQHADDTIQAERTRNNWEENYLSVR